MNIRINDRQSGVFDVQARITEFFTLAFGISWLLWLPDVLNSRGLAALPSCGPLATFGPALAALILTGLREGRDAVRSLSRKLLNFRMPRKWLVTILLLPPAVSGLATLIHLALGGTVPEGLTAQSLPFSQPFSLWPLVLPAYFVFSLVFQGPLGEELGWRGYALPLLLRRWNALWSSVILGILWGLWHIPLFLIIGSGHQTNLPVLVFLFSTVPLSILFTWLIHNSGGNLVAAVLFHQMVNFSIELNPVVFTRPLAFTLMVILYGVAAGGVAWLWGPRHLSKSRGPDPAQEQI